MKELYSICFVAGFILTLIGWMLYDIGYHKGRISNQQERIQAYSEQNKLYAELEKSKNDLLVCDLQSHGAEVQVKRLIEKCDAH